MTVNDPFDPGIRFGLAGGFYFTRGIECSSLTTMHGERGVSAEIVVRSRRGGGKLVKARSASRSYRRAAQGKTQWSFGDVVVRIGTRTLTLDHPAGARVTLTGSVTP